MVDDDVVVFVVFGARRCLPRRARLGEDRRRVTREYPRRPPSASARRSNARRTCLDPFKCARSSSASSLQQRVRLARKQMGRTPTSAANRRFSVRGGPADARALFLAALAGLVDQRGLSVSFPGLASVAPLRDGVFFVDRVAFALVNRSASASESWRRRAEGAPGGPSSRPAQSVRRRERFASAAARAASPAAANAPASRPSGPFWSITTDVVITSGTRSGDERTSDAFSAAV